MAWWLCQPCEPLNHGEQYFHEAALVEADNPFEAAKRAAEWIKAESSEDLDPEYLDTMFAVPIDPERQVAMNSEPHYVKAEMQCCGGPIDTGGHSGLCRTKRE